MVVLSMRLLVVRGSMYCSFVFRFICLFEYSWAISGRSLVLLMCSEMKLFTYASTDVRDMIIDARRYLQRNMLFSGFGSSFLASSMKNMASLYISRGKSAGRSEGLVIGDCKSYTRQIFSYEGINNICSTWLAV